MKIKQNPTILSLKSKNEIAVLVKRVSKGDMLAAELLYEKFSAAMYTVSFRITNNRQSTEDIIQEVFVKSFTRINLLKDHSRYGGWLKQMITNASIDAVRKQQKWTTLNHSSEPIDDLREEAIPKISQERIRKAVATLPDRSRVVFTLYLLEGNTHAEIARKLDISVSTSKSQYRYALQLLRTILKKEIYE